MSRERSPAGSGRVRGVVRYIRSQVAPRISTTLLNGLARSGLLSGARRVLPPRLFQSALRFTNWAILFTPGRRYLEKVLMPATCPPAGTRVVLVGLHPYTTHYSYFYAEQQVFAFDPEPRMAAYRGRATFFPRRLRELARTVGPGTVGLIHCNGVYGWGLDDQRELEESLESVYEGLVPGGVLLFGYNLKNNNPLGWNQETALPPCGLVELRRTEYPICLGQNQVFRVFQKPS